MVNAIVTHKFEVVTVLFLLSEGLGMIPSVKSNGVFQLIYSGLKSLHDKMGAPLDAKASAPVASPKA